MNNMQNTEPLGWVLYDASCGFCSWWIPFWEKTIRRAGYAVAPLQEKWVRERLRLPDDQINKDILLLLKGGQTISGADAYIRGMQEVWWSRPVGYLLILPGFYQCTWLFYRLFNRNRFLVSKACRLKPAQIKI